MFQLSGAHYRGLGFSGGNLDRRTRQCSRTLRVELGDGGPDGRILSAEAAGAWQLREPPRAGIHAREGHPVTVGARSAGAHPAGGREEQRPERPRR